MMSSESKKWLNKHFNKNVTYNESMKKNTSFKVGGPAEAFITPDDVENLILLIKWAKKKKIHYRIIGDGTNLLVKDNGIKGLVIALKKFKKKIQIVNKENESVFVKAIAGTKTSALCKFAIKKGFEGMNFALGIPGTIGASILMNAGTNKGYMGEVIESIKILDEQNEVTIINKNDLVFNYKNIEFKNNKNIKNKIVVLEAVFKLKMSDKKKIKKQADDILNNRNKSQPITLPSAGCIFKNPESERPAGMLIEMAGLKGKKIGDAEVSEQHANFIVNKGNAKAEDIIRLIEEIKIEIYNKFNVNLENEVKIVGF